MIGMRHLALVALVAVVASCHNEVIAFNQLADVGGEWQITATNVSGGGLACSVNNLTVALTQTDTVFSGTVLSGTITCVQGIFSGTRSADIGSTVGGAVSGRAITIADTTIGAALSGTVANGNTSMSGTCSVQLTLGDGSVVTVTGPWSGFRLKS
jgi:hypothetical protein